MSRVLVDATGAVSGGILRGLVETIEGWPEDDELLVVGSPDVCAAVGPRAAARPVGGASRRALLAEACVVLPRERRSWSPDAVLSFSPGLPGAVVRPDVTVLHDLFFRLWPAGVRGPVRAYRGVSYRSALTASRRVACVSERTRHDLAGWLPDVAARAQVWRPGVAAAFLQAAPVDGPRHDVVVPAHNDYKRPGLVVAAFDRPDDPAVVLLAGSPARAAELVERFAGAPRPPVVLARLEDDELVARLASAACMVMASDIEGAGLPVLEALALATPVVVSPDPALVETSAGWGQAMTTWSPDAVRTAVTAALALPAPHWQSAATAVRQRPWSVAASELRELLLGG